MTAGGSNLNGAAPPRSNKESLAAELRLACGGDAGASFGSTSETAPQRKAALQL